MGELESTLLLLLEDVGADHQLLGRCLDSGELLITNTRRFGKRSVSVIILIGSGLAFFGGLVIDSLQRVLSHVESVDQTVDEDALFGRLLAHALAAAARPCLLDLLLDTVDYSFVRRHGPPGIGRGCLGDGELDLLSRRLVVLHLMLVLPLLRHWLVVLQLLLLDLVPHLLRRRWRLLLLLGGGLCFLHGLSRRGTSSGVGLLLLLLFSRSLALVRDPDLGQRPIDHLVQEVLLVAQLDRQVVLEASVHALLALHVLVRVVELFAAFLALAALDCDLRVMRLIAD